MLVRLWVWLPGLLLMMSLISTSCWDTNANEELMKEEKLRFLDRSKDMCSDFHSFACGDLTESVNLRELSKNWRIPEFDYDGNSNISSDDSSMHRTAKQFYRTCMQVDSHKKGRSGESTLKMLLKTIGVAVSDEKWDQSKFKLVDVVFALRKAGVPYNWLVEKEVPSTNDVTPAKPSSMETVTNFTSNELHIDILVEIFEELGLGSSRTDIRKDMSELLRYDRYMNQLIAEEEMHLPDEETLRKALVKHVEEFAKTLPESACKNTNLCTSRPFESYSREFQSLVLTVYMLLKNTPGRIASDYIALKLIQAHTPFLKQSIRENLEDLRRLAKGGPRDTRTRKEVCLAETKFRFQVVAETEYMRKHPSSKAKQKIQEMYGIVQDEFVAHLVMAQYSEFLELKNVELVLGLPDKVADWKFLDLEYSDSDNIVEMAAKFSKSFQDLSLDKERYEKWTKERQLLNVSHQAYLRNQPLTFAKRAEYITMPYSYTDDSVLFSGDQPNYYSFANMAIEIARTRVNLFLRKMHRAHSTIKQPFLDQNRCILKDYVRSKENLPPFSDWFLELSYGTSVTAHIGHSAFQKWLKNNAPKKLSPDQATPQQTFWLKNTLYLCQMMRSNDSTNLPEPMSNTEDFFIPDDIIMSFVEKLKETEEFRKPIERFLVEEALKNSKDFEGDFKCNSRTPMNPEKKCVLK